MKKAILTIFSFCIFYWYMHCQYKLADLPYKLFDINKKDNKGHKQGIWVYFNKIDSTIFSKQHYVNDTLHGPFEKYWYNGKTSDIGYYKNGLFDSTFIGYWDNGKKRIEVIYIEGRLNGIATSYDIEGKITSIAKYINGSIDSTYPGSFLDSNLISDSQAKYNEDTVITNFKSKWNKRCSVFVRDTLSKEIDFYKGRMAIEGVYRNGILSKRIIYSKRSPYRIEKVFYFKKGKLDKTEYYDNQGKVKLKK